MNFQSRFLTSKPGPGAMINWGHPLAKDLVACFLFNEGAGNVVRNLVDLKAGAPISSNNSVAWNLRTPYGASIDVPGTANDPTTGPTWVNGTNFSALSFFCLFNVRSAGRQNYGNIFGKGYRNCVFHMNTDAGGADNKVLTFDDHFAGGTTRFSSASNAVTYGNWYDAVVAYKPGTNTARCDAWLNGQSIIGATNSPIGTTDGIDGTYAVGDRTENDNQGNVIIAAWYVWKRLLNQSEAMQLHSLPFGFLLPASRDILAITKVYTRTFRFSLPTNNSDLDTAFNDSEYTAVAADDGSAVTQQATDAYSIFEFKDDASGATEVTITWKGQSDVAPLVYPVYLEIYNHNTTSWDTLTSNSVLALTNVDFTLSFFVDDLTNYKDGSGVMSCRVRQAPPISSSCSSCSSSSSSCRSSSSSSSSSRSSSSSSSFSSSSSCRSSSSSSSRSSSSSSSCCSSSSSSSSQSPACWVAAEIFGGWYASKTVLARLYVLNLAPVWFKNFYIEHGRSIAVFIRRRPVLKAALRPLFEYFAARGKSCQ